MSDSPDSSSSQLNLADIEAVSDLCNRFAKEVNSVRFVWFEIGVYV